MTQSHNPFTHTGALRPDHPLFRGREELMQRLERSCLEPGDAFIMLYGGRRNGKTSLLLWLEQRLRGRAGEGVGVCRVSFQGLPRASAAEVYRHLARSVARALPQHQPPLDAASAPDLLDAFEAALAPAGVTRFVLLLDELGTLPETTRADLAYVLSDLHTRRLHSPPLAKMQVLIAGGVELHALVSVEASALRNVSTVVRLDDLAERKAIALLAAGLTMAGAPPELAELLGVLVYARVRGHPYLTQRLGELLAERLLEGETPDEELIEALCWRLLEGDDALLSHLRHKIGELGLGDAARRLLSVSQRTARTDEQIDRLDLLGLARRGVRHWEPRSPLLAVALAEWTGLPLPEGPLPEMAQYAQNLALQRLIAERRQEQRAATRLAEQAATPADQVRLQRRASDLADEIARIEAIRQPARVSELAPPPQLAQPPDGGAETAIRAPSKAQQDRPPRALPSWVPELLKVAAGPFLMGSADTDTQADSDEKPQHRLELPDFWIGRTPITNAQFRPFVEGDGYSNRAYWTAPGWEWRQKEAITQPGYWTEPKWNLADQPVVGVSWFEAVAYCRWLSTQTGLPFRLPSEAEWEKAARGPDGRIWPWGDRWEAGRCNSNEMQIYITTPVERYPHGSSPCGALDMAGNVWEWCATQYDKRYPYEQAEEWAETYLEADVPRRLRGGSFAGNQKSVRGAYRFYIIPRLRVTNRGLRVASHSPRPDAEF